MVEDGSVNPRSSLALSVSDREIITVRKMMTLGGSPWYTPNFKGNGGVNQLPEETVAESPEYHDCSSLQNSGGAW